MCVNVSFRSVADDMIVHARVLSPDSEMSPRGEFPRDMRHSRESWTHHRLPRATVVRLAYIDEGCVDTMREMRLLLCC